MDENGYIRGLRTRMAVALLLALLVATAIALLTGNFGSAAATGTAEGRTPTPASADAPAPAAASAATRPPIVKRLIPYGAKRKRDMAAYSKRHYGGYKWRLTAPKLVVQHFAVAGSIGAIYNTFAPNRPDVEYGERPGVCSHYAVGADGKIVKFVRTDVRCRHVVGLNHVSVGIEHVGFSDADVLNRPAQLEASLALTQWLRCRFGIPVKQVIGHNESLSSRFYRELDPRFRGRTHGDFKPASMRTYRGRLAALGDC
jgi:N-acetylmuramoyl-L-alanine amidase